MGNEGKKFQKNEKNKKTCGKTQTNAKERHSFNEKSRKSYYHKWYLKHKELVLKQKEQYYKSHKDLVLQKHKEFYLKEKDKVNQRKKTAYWKNKAKPMKKYLVNLKIKELLQK